MGGLTSLANPIWLLGILVVAALLAGYVYNETRRRKRTLKFANMSVLDSVAPPGKNRWRHLPIALLAIGLVLLMIGAVRPQGHAQGAAQPCHRRPHHRRLALDGGQGRLARPAHRGQGRAAKKFITELPTGVNLGIVSYAGTASLLVSPTPDRSLALNAVDKLELAQRTATGEGIYTAIQSIKNIRDVLGARRTRRPPGSSSNPTASRRCPPTSTIRGAASTAARKAKEEGIPISTISFGTDSGTVNIGGQNIPVPVDDASLKRIAELSGGKFFAASSLSDLNEAYGSLRDEIGWEMQKGDNSRVWMLWGTLIILVGAAAAVGMNRRLP